jgi:hypothetical protein
MNVTREQIENAVKSKNYVWFNSDKDFDVNIVGVRSELKPDAVTNIFDDLITVSYKENGVWKFHSWPATVDPGTKGVREFRNPRGVARLVEGQYRRSHRLGLHQGKYQALTQVSELPVYRDNNKNMVFDESVIHRGVFGINIHKAGRDSTWVENWSEGCQVFKRSKDFDEFMSIMRKAAKIHGNSFTYTLLKSTDIS